MMHVLIWAFSKHPWFGGVPLTVMLEGHLHHAVFVVHSILLMEEILHHLIW